MTAIERTAYPCFKRILSAKDLEEVYTPTPAERFLALRSTKGTVAEIGFLVLLKTHQRLGRFIPLSDVPFSILNYILKLVDPSLDASDLESYDTSGTRQRHIPLIRAAREIQPCSPAARTCALKAMISMARTKEDVADLINVAQEPASPTFMHMRTLIDHLFAISEQRKLLPDYLLADIAEGKVKQFASEARALDATEMKDLEPHKRLTLTAAFVLVQSAGALDDLAEMFIKRMLAIHQKAKEALERYRADHQARTDSLVGTLRDLVVAYRKEGTTDERMAAMDTVIGDKASEVLQSCEEHLAHVGNNNQQFLWPFYRQHRAQLFRLLDVLHLRSSSQDRSLEETVHFLKRHAQSKGEWLITATTLSPGTPEE